MSMARFVRASLSLRGEFDESLCNPEIKTCGRILFLFKLLTESVGPYSRAGYGHGALSSIETGFDLKLEIIVGW